MVTEKVEKALNDQIMKEEHSSRLYLAMASWCERNGYQGASHWLYRQSDEERMHMLKLVHYLSDRGGTVEYTSQAALEKDFKSLSDIFQKVLKHEEFISKSINEHYTTCNAGKDYATAQFLQWYINEQIEEESTSRAILDKIRLAGTHEGGLFMIDKELGGIAATKKSQDG